MARHDRGCETVSDPSPAPIDGGWLATAQAMAQEWTGTAEAPFRPAPVAKWHPAYCADIGLEIRADGVWLHQGERFRRTALVQMFARLLRRDGPDEFYLVTPHEKVRIAVADAPFLITAASEEAGEGSPVLTLTTNFGEQVRVDADHPLFLRPPRNGGALRPYVMVRDGLEALLSRPVYFELAERLAELFPAESVDHHG